MTELEALREAARWRPIPGCPGRYKLIGEPPPLLLALVGDPSRTRKHSVNTARDVVLVVSLEGDGGVIAYLRSDGSMLYTLNTGSGFARKLAQLGIPLDRGLGHPVAQELDDEAT